MYVSIGNVRKSSFLCDFCMAKLYVLHREVKKVTVRYTYTMYVGMGDVRESSLVCDFCMCEYKKKKCVYIEKLFLSLRLCLLVRR